MVVTQDVQEALVVGYPKSGNTWLTRLVDHFKPALLRSSSDKRKNNILREGKSGVWERKLTIKQKDFLIIFLIFLTC